MKQALQERFADFLRLFAPEAADALDLDAGVTFRNAETFSDLPQGVLLVPDIVAEARTLAGEPELVIVHIEIQREREAEDFPRRMWRYYLALAQRENKPVLPIALLFYPAAEGIAWEVHEERLFGHTIAAFHYLQISLARLAPKAEEYLGTGNVLAAALAGIMGRSRRGAARVRLLYGCLGRLVDAEQAGEINPATHELLSDVVGTYLRLAREDLAAWRERLTAERGDSMPVAASELSWLSQADLEGSLRTLRKDIRKVVQKRFGQVSPEVDALIAGTEDEDALDALFDKALVAPTEVDLLR